MIRIGSPHKYNPSLYIAVSIFSLKNLFTASYFPMLGWITTRSQFSNPAIFAVLLKTFKNKSSFDRLNWAKCMDEALILVFLKGFLWSSKVMGWQRLYWNSLKNHWWTRISGNLKSFRKTLVRNYYLSVLKYKNYFNKTI
jgi:hypothetical protein